MSALFEAGPEASERHRRRLLDEADTLLGGIEELRLAEAPSLPEDLGEAVRRLQARLGRVEGRHRPRTLRAAQHLVFAVQQRLMAANPRNPVPRAHPGRPAGSPGVRALEPGGSWKFLTLPARPAGPGGPAAAEAAWADLVELTVERALDRWCYAQAQAVRAARDRRRAVHGLAMAGAAWANYWELRCEAEKLGISPSKGPGGRPP